MTPVLKKLSQKFKQEVAVLKPDQETIKTLIPKPYK